MNKTIKRFLVAFALFTFLGGLALLKVQRASRPFFGQLSEAAYVYSEPEDASLFGFKLPTMRSLSILSIFEGSTYLENTCLNGKSPSSMGTQEQLLEFIQGPCLPVVLVPGLYASKLQVNIDCETLKSENPEIFASCGWSTCSSFNLLGDSPSSSYTLWISDFVGPISIVFKGTGECFGNLVQMNYDSSQSDVAQKYSSPAGIEVIPKSHTIESSEKCGLASEDNLLLSPVQIGYTKGYEPMKEALIGMGYQVGLTLYGAPYDWRKTTVANGISTALGQTVQQIYSLTGKPSILVAHSLGNFGVLHMLNSMTTQEKDMYIANYVSVMNPLSGAPTAVLDCIGGDTDFVYKSFGIEFPAQKKMIQSGSGFFDVIIKDPFNFFAGQQWMEDWKTRITYENNYNVTTAEGQEVWNNLVSSGNYPYTWFPTPLQQCFEGFVNRPDQCGLYMYDWSAEPIVTVGSDSYTGSAEDMSEIFANYVTMTDIAPELFADAKTNNIYLLQNPEVPVTIMYLSHLPTQKAFEFDYDPTTKTDALNFAVPNSISYSQGDQTVPTSSSLLPALKWSWEFDNKAVPNAKPVKTAEVCSSYNVKSSIYDQTDSDSPYQVTYNEYMGVSCECQPQAGDTTTGEDCYHSEIIADALLIKFIQNIANANAPNTNFGQTGAYLLNDTQLEQLAKNCPTVNIGTTVYADLLNQIPYQSDSTDGTDGTDASDETDSNTSATNTTDASDSNESNEASDSAQSNDASDSAQSNDASDSAQSNTASDANEASDNEASDSNTTTGTTGTTDATEASDNEATDSNTATGSTDATDTNEQTEATDA